APATTEIRPLSLHDALPISLTDASTMGRTPMLRMASVAVAALALAACSGGDGADGYAGNASVASPEYAMAPAAPPMMYDKDAAADRKSTRLNSSHVKISYAV